MKYSKGPWTKDGDGFIWSPASTDYEVCHVPSKADAALIAAAPELLKALDELISEVFQGGIIEYMNEASSYKRRFNNVVKRAEAAIKKARG